MIRLIKQLKVLTIFIFFFLSITSIYANDSLLYYWPIKPNQTWVWILTCYTPTNNPYKDFYLWPVYPNPDSLKGIPSLFWFPGSNCLGNPFGAEALIEDSNFFVLQFDLPSRIWLCPGYPPYRVLLADFSIAAGDSFATGSEKMPYIKVLKHDSTRITFSNDASYAAYAGPDKIPYIVWPFILSVDSNDESDKIASFQLEQNYPNPFNASTTIDYLIRTPGQVQLLVYSITGQLVKELSHEFQAPGSYSITWDGADQYGHPAPSGVYWFQLKTEHFLSSKKMILLR